MFTNDEVYLSKMVGAKVPFNIIAAKLGITEAEARARWAATEDKVKSLGSNGYLELSDQYTIFCHQYQLLGESLKIIAGALGNAMTQEEIATLITNDPKQTLINLSKNCIILKPFTPVDPIKSLEEHLKNIQRDN